MERWALSNRINKHKDTHEKCGYVTVRAEIGVMHLYAMNAKEWRETPAAKRGIQE